jgi:hypothetical protein
MLFTFIGGAIGLVVGRCFCSNKKDSVSFLFDCGTMLFCTAVGAAAGFGVGVTLLSTGHHPVQKILA